MEKCQGMPHLGSQPAALKRFARGFTLMEVMIAMVIAGILSAMASVTLKTINSKLKVQGSLDDLRNAIQLAHSNAMSQKHNSGILIDVPNHRYLRFVDSSGAGASDGLYSTGETILQGWTALPSAMVFYNVASSLSPTPILRKCDAAQTFTSGATQVGTYAIVFRSDGSSWATFTAKLGVSTLTKDTFQLTVIPPTGYVTMDK
jgi:prepilin-type N-terminal cleavage/methylation domain-containing protein